MIRKFIIILIILIPVSSIASEKKTTFDKQLFKNALADGKTVVVSSWIKYCYSCASQMKVLNKANNELENMEYFAFDVTNKEISNLFNVKYQSTILIFKNNKEVYRSIGETSEQEIYSIINKYT